MGRAESGRSMSCRKQQEKQAANRTLGELYIVLRNFHSSYCEGSKFIHSFNQHVLSSSDLQNTMVG